jgi:hypothetical protein
MMRLSKRVIVWGYRARPSRFVFSCGAEHESDPDSFVIWLYLGLFGFAVGWSREGWVCPADFIGQGENVALSILRSAPHPQQQTPAFCDAWDRLEDEERR